MGARAGQDEAATVEPQRQPYVKPCIAWEESVEEQSRLMSGCGKLTGDGTCSGAEEVS